MSVCAADEFIEPVHAVVGDVIVLTKPLGTQIAVNLNEWTHLEDKKQSLTEVHRMIFIRNLFFLFLFLLLSFYPCLLIARGYYTGGGSRDLSEGCRIDVQTQPERIQVNAQV